MNRVMLFFDGKNFYKGFLNLIQSVGDGRHYYIDFTKLANWLVRQVQGTDFRGAYYYTAVGGAPDAEETRGLESFLKGLELETGFYVVRMERKAKHIRCFHCGKEILLYQEKEVDTQMVADMLQLAAVNAFDILVLLSGDTDFAPAVEAMRRLGKIVYVATWGRHGLSSRLRSSAFGHIDLQEGLGEFLKDEEGQPWRPPQSVGPTDRAKEGFLRALEAAEQHFTGGYVGLSYFLNRWIDPRLPLDVETRRALLRTLEEEGLVEVYTTDTGERAIRIRRHGTQEDRHGA